MTEQKELKVDDIKKLADEKKCPVQQALFYVSGFLDGPMCGRCFPCSMGSYEARIRLQRIQSGEGTEADIEALQRIADDMIESSMCKKGKDTAKFLQEWLQSDVFTEHNNGSCRVRECVDLFKYIIIPEKCILCGDCQDVCKDDAIIGIKKQPYRSGYFPFEIRQKRCTKCGECIKVCPVAAIEQVDENVSETVVV